MRRRSAADQVCVERDELLPGVSDRREIVGGPGFFAIVERGLAENGGRVGDEAGKKEAGKNEVKGAARLCGSVEAALGRGTD